MALGKFAELNLALTATLSGGANWTLPLSNLQIEPYLAAPARQTAPTALASSQFDLTFDRPQRVTVLGVLFHTLSIDALYRVSAAPIGGTLAAPSYQSGWTKVFPRLAPSLSLSWQARNWWRGRMQVRDLDIRPRHLWIVLPEAVLTPAVRIEIDDHGNTAGYFDLGFLWASAVWSPTFNFERGRKRGWSGRALVDEAPSGRLFTEARQGRRLLNLSWTALTDRDADELTDIQARAQGGSPVVFLPDTDDAYVAAREAFLGSVTIDGPTISTNGGHQASATLTEIIA